MKITRINSVEHIEEMSYPNFIGLINQWNTPPGSYSTINKLAIFSGMNKDSNLLEVGCSTGFSSRELCMLTDCKGIGIDMSRNSIDMANHNKREYASKTKLSYKMIDGYNYKPKGLFSHIMVGGNLKFFDNPEKMMSRCIEMVKDGGFILATPYYEIKKTPDNVAIEINKILGIPMSAFDNFTYKKMMVLYNKLEIVFEERNSLVQETEDEIKHYTQSIISRVCETRSINDPAIKQAMEQKLIKIRRLINSTRPYQEYAVLVLRYRKSVYPNRYTALF